MTVQAQRNTQQTSGTNFRKRTAFRPAVRRKKRVAELVSLGVAALVLSCCLSLLVSNGAFRTGDMLAVLRGGGGDGARLVFFRVRLPRTAAALLCGAALSVAGLLLQAALRNPLCSPGVLGINAGAGLFALLAGLLAPGAALFRGGMAFCGALLAIAMVYGISRRGGASKMAIVLSGVAVSSLLTAGTNAVITLWPGAVADKTAFSLGGLDGIAPGQIAFTAAVLAVALPGAWALAGGLDLFALGDEAAAGLGLAVSRTRTLAVLWAALLSAAAVSMCGLLGFVGLMVPNLLRMASGGECRENLLLCVLWGGAFLCLCDVAARTIVYPYQLPTGLVLSLTGAPFFIFLLTRRKRGMK